MVEPEVEAFNRGPPQTRDRDQRLLDITQGEAGMRMAVVVVKSSVKAYRLSCVRDCKQVQTLFKQTSFWSQAPISISPLALSASGCGSSAELPVLLLSLAAADDSAHQLTYSLLLLQGPMFKPRPAHHSLRIGYTASASLSHEY